MPHTTGSRWRLRWLLSKSKGAGVPKASPGTTHTYTWRRSSAWPTASHLRSPNRGASNSLPPCRFPFSPRLLLPSRPCAEHTGHAVLVPFIRSLHIAFTLPPPLPATMPISSCSSGTSTTFFLGCCDGWTRTETCWGQWRARGRSSGLNSDGGCCIWTSMHKTDTHDHGAGDYDHGNTGGVWGRLDSRRRTCTCACTGGMMRLETRQNTHKTRHECNGRGNEIYAVIYRV